MKCDNCLNSRSIISESGLHHVCSLSEKKTVDYMLDKKNYEAYFCMNEDTDDDVMDGGICFGVKEYTNG